MKGELGVEFHDIALELFSETKIVSLETLNSSSGIVEGKEHAVAAREPPIHHDSLSLYTSMAWHYIVPKTWVVFRVSAAVSGHIIFPLYKTKEYAVTRKLSIHHDLTVS